MTDYLLRLYRGNAIEADLPLDAESDYRALAIAMVIHDACQDVCDDFELRRDGIVIQGRTRGTGRLPVRPHELTLRTQERVVQVEETILASAERLAQSRQLLARTQLYKSAIEKERKGE
jgi:hypothetical protein